MSLARTPSSALAFIAVLVAAAPAAAQYVDFDDIVIPSGGSVPLDMSGDGAPDLIFHGPGGEQPGSHAFTVETAPGVKVCGTESDDGSGLLATALPPGTFLGSNFDWGLPSHPGTLLLADASGEDCAGGWCTPGTRFVGVRVGFDSSGWVRVESRLDANGLPELVLLDMQMIGGSGLGMPTLINGFYMEQECVDGRDSVTVWMGGVWPTDCTPGGIVLEIDGPVLNFRVNELIVWGGCDYMETPWVRTRTFPNQWHDLPAGTFELTSSVHPLHSPPQVTERGMLHIACCPLDINGDGAVNSADLLLLLSQWGDAPALGVSADIDGDGIVGLADLSLLLAAWGSSSDACNM